MATMLAEMAAFIARTADADLSQAARDALKVRVLDSLGCALGAMAGEPVRAVRAHTLEFGGAELCTLIGGGQSAPDRAAFYNAALVRYLDFNDSYLAPGETCHPSDNLGAVLAAAEYADGSGRDLLTALAVAYQTHCRLCDVAPVRAKGFDHTTLGAYAVAAGTARALGLDAAQTAHALAISGTVGNALRVTRTGSLSHWKGLAAPHAAFTGVHAAFLARRGITGPFEVFEGNKGFMDAIAGRFRIEWSRENLERVTRTILKKYNAEIHSQSALDAALQLRREAGFSAADVERVAIETFDVAHNIIGGGDEGDKTVVSTKEEADHSLPYMVAVALLDGQVMPEQYLPARIRSTDVQTLLRRVSVQAADRFSRRFPDEMPCRIAVTLRDGRLLVREPTDYEGFHTRPMRWETVVEKFEALAGAHAEASLRRDVVGAVATLESIRVSDLTRLLAQAGAGAA